MEKPRVLYGTVKKGMESAQAAARTDYFYDSSYFGFLPFDNVHDLIFFPVMKEDMESMDIAIVTYNFYYPLWAKTSPHEGSVDESRIDLEDPSIIKAGGYSKIKDCIKCLVVGDGKYTNRYRLSYYELYYFPKK
jgi:hypothetical protein